MHNIRNSLAAIASGLALGTTVEAMRAGLEAFTGVERRFERLGDAGRSLDRSTTTLTIRPRSKQRYRQPARLFRSTEYRPFQPHLYTRTRDFHREFASALGLADVVYLCDLYPAREQPIAGVTARLVSESMAANGRAPDWKARARRLPPPLQPEFGPATSSSPLAQVTSP
jgi:UDP-N-acetylmuramate--alanine ligase